MRAFGRLTLVVVGLLSIAFVGMLAGLRIAGPTTHDTHLGRVELDVRPALDGAVDAFIPLANWGVRAHAFKAPVHLHIEPRSVNRQGVIRAASGDTSVLAKARQDGRDAAQSALIRALLAAVAGAALAGVIATLVLRRRSRKFIAALVLAPPALAAVVAGAVLLRIDSTFDARAFEAPTFYARGAELAQLLKVAEKAQTEVSAYRSSVDRTLSGYATLLSTGSRISARPTQVSAALISDLHGNALVLPALKHIANGQPVFFAGDLGQSGSAAEAKGLVPRLTELGRPIVAVSGNHDSALLMRRLAAARVMVLTDTGRLRADGGTDGEPVQTVAGLAVAGYPDPLEWSGADPTDPKRVYSFSEMADGDDRFDAAARSLITWFKGLDRRPDVVLVHQNGLAQRLAAAVSTEESPPLVILTGHDHRQHVDIYGGTLVIDAGTAGAGGIFGAGRSSVGVGLLRFASGVVTPRAIDLVRFEPLSGTAQAARVVPGGPDTCAVENVTCHDVPARK
jgi:predicted phosphodiesterase